jgi:hypothetical protein
MMRNVWIGWLLAAIAACAGPGTPEQDEAAELRAAGYEVLASRASMFTAAWRVAGGGAVPENEPFELEVLLFEGVHADVPLTGAELLVSAWMPDHGHGMSRKPEAVEVAPGRFRVHGMLLHMGGFWQLFLDVIRGGVSERAQFEIEL